jgi:hypothetical protein
MRAASRTLPTFVGSWCGKSQFPQPSSGSTSALRRDADAHVSRHGHAFIDRALYLPKEWTDDRRRLKAAHVPNNVEFATKPQIARRMITRAIAAKVPFSFVATDTVYCSATIRMEVRLRLAPPEMFLNTRPLPHVNCSPVGWDCGGDNEATEYGDSKRTDSRCGAALQRGEPRGEGAHS